VDEVNHATGGETTSDANVPYTVQPDHLGFLSELDAILLGSSAPQLGVALISLDCVSQVDGALGYIAGDALCSQVVSLLRHALKAEDCIYRVGRNELACVFHRLPSETHAVLAAYKVLRTLSTPQCVQGYYFDVNPVVGITLASLESINADEMLRQANMATQQAKLKSERFAVYAPKLEVVRLEQLQLQAELRDAITQNKLEVYFQPKVDLQTGVIVGVESLVRWNHPTKGQIPPSVFVSLAESSGFISELTLRVLSLTLSHYQALHKVTESLHIAINLSPKDLRDSDFPDVMQTALNDWDIPADCVTLELVEATLMEDQGVHDESLEALQKMGLHLSIDDFGTGYFSMNRLRNLPVDEIKIDMSFVRHMLSYASDEWIVQSIIKIAHDLNIKVVAEGVEDTATLQRLKELGCDFAQGFCISPPLSPAEILTFLSEWKGLPA
jgi:EAL domain-containing protein (putative c-di-GMP-specific phosphodiesterase class I)/GGDEF domain-containing protein